MRISDWSSDVCSSDLRPEPLLERLDELPVRRGVDRLEVVPGRVLAGDVLAHRRRLLLRDGDGDDGGVLRAEALLVVRLDERSEERRVGKECVSKWRSRW